MPDILDSESWKIIMTAMYKIEKMLAKHLDKVTQKTEHPDFAKIRKLVNENALNNPAVSKKYQEEIDKKALQSLPSHQIIGKLNPSLKKPLEISQKMLKSRSEARKSGDLGSLQLNPSFSEVGEDIYPDLEILRAALDSLFTSTFMYADNVLIEFLKGLGNLVKHNSIFEAGIESFNTQDTSESSKTVVPNKKKDTAIFGIVRMVEVTLINMNRIDLIWDTVVIEELSLITS